MEKLTEQKVFKDLVVVFREIHSLELDVKGILEEAKECLPEYTDLAGIKKYAKLVATHKAEDAVAKMEGFLSLVDQLED